MRLPKVISFAALSLMLLFTVDASAQLRTSYFMEGTYFRTELNPALVPTRGYIALPLVSGVGVNINSNFLSFENMFLRSGNVYNSIFSGVLPPSEVMKGFPEVLRMHQNATVNIFGAGHYKRKMFWSYGINARHQSTTNVSRDMLGSMVLNEPQKVKSSYYDATSYLEAYVGSSLRLFRIFSVGFRVKALVGVMNVHGKMLEAGYDASSQRSTVYGEYLITGMPVTRETIRPDQSYTRGQIFSKEPTYLLKGKHSVGIALDLGGEVRLFRDHLRLSAAVTDVGFIRWSDDRMVGVGVTSTHSLKDASIEEAVKGGDPQFSFVGRDVAKPDNTRMLNFSANLGAELVMWRNHLSLGVLAHGVRCSDGSLFRDLTASLNIRPNSWLSATVSKTLYADDARDVFGVALNFHPRGINIFVGADFFDYKFIREESGAYIFPRPMSHSIYAGVAFNLKRPRFIVHRARALREARYDDRVKRRAQRQAHREVVREAQRSSESDALYEECE